jgi:hypothetical protein
MEGVEMCGVEANKIVFKNIVQLLWIRMQQSGFGKKRKIKNNRNEEKGYQ